MILPQGRSCRVGSYRARQRSALATIIADFLERPPTYTWPHQSTGSSRLSATSLQERIREMDAITKLPDSERYARCIQASKRVRWDLDKDVIQGRRFDP